MNIPETLQRSSRWLHWKRADGTKKPYSPGKNRLISATDPANWMTYRQARTWRIKDGGLGFALPWQSGVMNFAVVDLDDCLNEMGTPNAAALDTIKLVASYAEVSPSGYGLKIFCQIDEPLKTIRTPGIEILAGGFACVTGLQLLDYPGCTELVNNRTPVLKELLAWQQLMKTLDDGPGGLSRITGVQPDGNRNVSLFRHACSLRASGLDPREIFQNLVKTNVEFCVPPKPRQELITITRSVCRYPAGSNDF